MRPDSCVGEEAIKDLIRLAKEAPHGVLVEVGVYKGGTAWFLAEVARDKHTRLHLFDTFTGIPYKHPTWDNHLISDFNDTDVQKVAQLIPDACIHAGVFPDTLYPLPPVGFVHCDCDQYQSVSAVCDSLPPMMVPGGIIVFDDYNCLEGATRAVDERFMVEEKTRYGKAVVRIGQTKER